MQVRDLAVRSVDSDDRVAEPLLALWAAVERKNQVSRSLDEAKSERERVSQPRLGNPDAPVLQAEQLPVECLLPTLGDFRDDACLTSLARSLDERPLEKGTDVGHRQQRREERNDFDRVKLCRVSGNERKRRLNEERRGRGGECRSRSRLRRLAWDEVDSEEDEEDAGFRLSLVYCRAVSGAKEGRRVSKAGRVAKAVRRTDASALSYDCRRWT